VKNRMTAPNIPLAIVIFAAVAAVGAPGRSQATGATVDVRHRTRAGHGDG
jgi:hypothetical protein